MHLFLLFSPLILFPAFGEPIPDYNDPYSPIFTDNSMYSWTDKVKMTIVAPSWNTNRHLIDSIGDTEDHSIKISTRDHSLEPYRFTETDANSGIFTAEIILTGFSHDANGDGNTDTTPRTTGNGPTGGFLEVDRDSAVTISFEFADGVILTESVPVGWNLGTIQFLEEIFSSDKSAVVRVIDPDMNLRPEAIDTIQLEFFSDSDSAGIGVDAIETSESSGLFLTTIFFSQTSSSSGNRLYVLPGDQIIAKYDDYTLPKPYSISDNLKIETFAKIKSSVLPTDRLKNLPIVFSDSLDNELRSFSTNDQIQIVGTLLNQHDFRQKFVYLFQVKDSTNHVESISWIQGELYPDQSIGVSRSWIPKNSGIYTVETFVWDSLVSQIPLGNLTSTTVYIN